MTIRELSEVAGCGHSTVKRVGKMMFPNVKAIGRGIALEYTEDESIAIMAKLPKKTFISDPSIGQMTDPNIGQTSQPIDYEALTKSIMVAITATIAPLIDKAIENKMGSNDKLALLPPKQDRNTLRQLVAKYAKERCSGDHSNSWHYLYDEVYYRLGFGVRVRAKNKGVSKLDMIGELGIISECCSIMREALV